MNNEGSDLELKSSCKDVFQRCIKCGACMQDRETGLPICPTGEVYGFESYYLRGKVEIVRGLMEGRFDSNKSSKLTHILYSCTDCRACVEQCYLLSGVDFLKCVRLARASLTEKGTIPSKVSEFLEHIYRIGNPYGYDQEERAKFLEGLGVDEFDESQEYLYYVDGIEVYDALARNTIAALVGLLQATKISFGVIYRGIECTGNEALSLGEKSLFDYLKQRNLETFRKLKVRKILTTSPHTYHALAKLYGLDNIK
ncbi:MAG: (Fe-S)-binding protein, partial [Nanoarchaeota archaeon]|nr:(Fe-S)-binding protein [Nanoarchaeota archaeon]